jgi:hypothetical protein
MCGVKTWIVPHVRDTHYSCCCPWSTAGVHHIHTCLYLYLHQMLFKQIVLLSMVCCSSASAAQRHSQQLHNIYEYYIYNYIMTFSYVNCALLQYNANITLRSINFSCWCPWSAAGAHQQPRGSSSSCIISMLIKPITPIHYILYV